MTTNNEPSMKKSRKNPRLTHVDQNNATQEENTIMTTIKNATSTTESSSQASTTTQPLTPAYVLYMQPPPKEAVIPRPPSSFEVTPNARYGVVQPKKAEMVWMPRAVVELGQFTDYAATLGKTVPPLDSVIQWFDAANQWTTMRVQSAAWDAYCNAQEAQAWQGVREHIKRIKPAFALAAQSDPVLRDRFPNLASLLDAKAVIAHKAVATRRMNKQAEAEGKQPLHGQVGKKRKRAAEKAAGAAQAQQPAQHPQQPAQPQPATPPPTASNGAAHS
jgi:hypothetical protein